MPAGPSPGGQHLHLIETDGAHVGFAPLDEDEARVERSVREKYGPGSVERAVSGPSLLESIGRWAAEGSRTTCRSGRPPATWPWPMAPNAAVISSGLSRRLAPWLKSPLFGGRFVVKGRYRRRMEGMRVRLALVDEPGPLGAAVAYQRRAGLALD